MTKEQFNLWQQPAPGECDTGDTVDDREQWPVSQVSGYPGLMVSASDATDHTTHNNALPVEFKLLI